MWDPMAATNRFGHISSRLGVRGKILSVGLIGVIGIVVATMVGLAGFAQLRSSSSEVATMKDGQLQIERFQTIMARTTAGLHGIERDALAEGAAAATRPDAEGMSAFLAAKKEAETGLGAYNTSSLTPDGQAMMKEFGNRAKAYFAGSQEALALLARGDAASYANVGSRQPEVRRSREAPAAPSARHRNCAGQPRGYSL